MPAKEMFKRALRAMESREQMFAEHAKVDQEVVKAEIGIISAPMPIQPTALPIIEPSLPEARSGNEIAAQSAAVAKEVLSNWGLPANRENAFAVAEEVAGQMASAIAREGAIAKAEQALHEQKIQVIQSALKKEGDYWGEPALPEGGGGSWF